MPRHCPPSNRGRREDRVPAGTHGPRATKKHAVRTTGSAERTRPSLRNGFNGFLRALSGEPGFLATVARKMRKHLCGLSASVGAPRPHDFAVRDKIIRLVIYRVHRIPCPTFVTIAKRPSYRVRDARMIALIWGKRQCPSGCGRLARRATQFSCLAVIASEGGAALSAVIPGRRVSDEPGMTS